MGMTQEEANRRAKAVALAEEIDTLGLCEGDDPRLVEILDRFDPSAETMHEACKLLEARHATIGQKADPFAGLPR